MSDTVSIPLDQARNKALFHYAAVVLGLEVSSGANDTTLRSKILAAAPDTTEIKVPANVAGPAAPATVAPIAAVENADKPRKLTSHFRDDPRVELTVMGSADKTRAKDVQIAVNGDVVIIQRGKTVDIPYRHFLALRDAVETIGRETDEINPVTGLPIIEWVDQPSYPFSVSKMPSEAEIAAYHARCDDAAIGIAA
ncbi:hypothetical protein [Sphingobium xenophagum]|uniref:hypothetical protein n=1 Tax=Sphingobium xenophagum TaxID=121428 RepID=UPI0002E2792E|nr:hypothetical protein [Sphingobium xenophagum]